MKDSKQINKELRAVLKGERPASGTILAKCAERVAHWQQLARRYRGAGLSREEVEEFWQELQEQRTTMDLMLQISMRDGEWKDACQEVKSFIEELTYEVEAEDGVHQRLLEEAARDDDDWDCDWMEEGDQEFVVPGNGPAFSDEQLLAAVRKLEPFYQKELRKQLGPKADTRMIAALARLYALIQTRMKKDPEQVIKRRVPEALDMVLIAETSLIYLEAVEDLAMEMAQRLAEAGCIDDDMEAGSKLEA